MKNKLLLKWGTYLILTFALCRGVVGVAQVHQPNDIKASQKSQPVVFDTTTSDDSIEVTLHHLFIEASKGLLSLREIIIFNNQGSKTFIGKREVTPGVRETLRFSLPDGFINTQLESGLSRDHADIKDNYLFDTVEVPPGTRQIAFRYQLPFDASEFVLQRKLDYPTTLFNLFVNNPSLGIASADLTFMGEFNIRDKTYFRYAGENLSRGHLLEVQLSHLPTPLPHVKWIALLAVGVMFIWGLAYALLQGRQRQDSSHLEKDRVQLIATIARLDNRYESGELPKGVYFRKRSKLKKRLIQLYLDLKSERTDGELKSED
ncbi:MAG: hypothetical protein ONB05_09905 [candidate division KSB1 bacterium]|nr:hypothetical protein [candidate division KSB1 bacterium]